MPTTSNFGWTTPADTDLVKDGASAIRTLGNGVDTSMAQLKGGTTGQVLSKTSGTDMAFTWVTQDDANAIQNAIVDAKGDLISATANDTPARLAVGNNGETLVADSSATTGLRYSPAPALGNPVLNSAFQVWQRGTSFTGSGFQYAADRWQVYRAVTGYTVTRQTTSDTTNLPNIQYAMRQQRDSGNNSTSDIYLAQSFETINSIPFAGKTVTLSFYARAGANWSPTSGNLRARLFTGTGTDQNVLSAGYTGSATPIDQNSALTTTWQRFSYSATLSASLTEIGVYFNATPVGTAGANDWFEITGIQLDLGSVALPFRTYSGTLAGELAACQRYYQITTSGYAQIGFGARYNSTTVAYSTPIPVQMRTTPTVTYVGTVSYSSNGTGGTLSSPSATNSSPGFITVLATSSITPPSAYPCAVEQGTTQAFSAEL